MADQAVIARSTSASLRPVLRELIDEARGKGYGPGALGVRITLDGHGSYTFTHDQMPVRVEPCVSALAVREALLSRVDGEWLFVLTDRTDADLGTGVLSHLIGHRVRNPDPWTAVRHRFSATSLDPVLTSRDIAVGLLAATPEPEPETPGGWPPAPGGVLTRDHAFGAVAAAHLGLTDPVVDTASVLGWTADPALAARISGLRTLGGDAVTDATLDWLADRTGSLAPVMRHLLSGGEAYDAVPLGLVAGVLAAAPRTEDRDQAQVARDALIRMEVRTGGAVPSAAVLGYWAAESATVVTGLLQADSTLTGSAQAEAGRLLARADQLLATVRARELAGASDLLPSGLARRLAALADTLRAAAVRGSAATGHEVATTPHGSGVDSERPVIGRADLELVERAWAWAASHQHANPDDGRILALHAAVRLTRWLARDTTVERSLPMLLRRKAEHDAWVDAAISDATAGADDRSQSTGIEPVLATAKARRAVHDAAFAHALAAFARDPADPGSTANQWSTGGGDIPRVENLLPDVVFPLARKVPVLLLVLDGMSAAICVQIMTGILSRPRDGWSEALVGGRASRAAALAVRPARSGMSRASLLSGAPRTLAPSTGGPGTGIPSVGGPDVERAEYAALARAKGLPGAALFHPPSSPGITGDVSAAIADASRHPLVTCVLDAIAGTEANEQDSEIARSPETARGSEITRRLSPFLERARDAGRVVILTTDHGREHSHQSGTTPAEAAGRARAAEHAEVSEAVIPVAVLVSGPAPEGTGLTLAPPQEPQWWIDPVLCAHPPLDTLTQRPGRANRPGPPPPNPRKRPNEDMPTLFDTEPTSEDAEPRGAPEPRTGTTTSTPDSIARAVFSSPAYAAHKRRIGRVSVKDAQASALLEALLAATSRRLAPDAAAAALGVPRAMLRGAVSQVQQLLNIDGAAVIRVDADGATVILDAAALAEQHGVEL